MAKNYYQILEVKKTDSIETIKKSYKKLALKYHPDKAEESKKKEYESNFQAINEAYSILSDPAKKQRYDSGETGNFSSRSSGSGSMSDFGDIFGDLFRGRFNESSYDEETDLDLHYGLVIDFNEAAFGCEKEIMIKRNVQCKKCKGSGSEDGKFEKCERCGGSGKLEANQQTPWGLIRQKVKCPSCNGVGKKAKNECNSCNGSGVQSSKEKVKIKIPAGIDNGQTLRVMREGDFSKGGDKGDLFLRIQITPHKTFRREDVDVYIDFPISFSQAALGDKLMIPTISEEVKIKIAAGTESGSVLRIREQGIPHINNPKYRGDQFVKLIIKTPKKLTRAQTKLFKELGKLD